MRGSFGLGRTQRGLLWRGGGMRGTPGRGSSIGKGSEAGRGRCVPGLKEECEGVLRVGSPGKTVCCPEGAREAGRRLNPPGLRPAFSRFPGPAPSPISGPGTGDGGVSSSAPLGWGVHAVLPWKAAG